MSAKFVDFDSNGLILDPVVTVIAEAGNETSKIDAEVIIGDRNECLGCHTIYISTHLIIIYLFN